MAKRTNGVEQGGEVPDPEVDERPRRRRFTAEYKLSIIEQADACDPGELGALLRREGLYSSHLSDWRRARREGALGALVKKRGRKPTRRRDRVTKECERLRRENTKLKRRLEQAEVIIAVQKKVSEILAIPLNSPDDEEGDS